MTYPGIWLGGEGRGGGWGGSNGQVGRLAGAVREGRRGGGDGKREGGGGRREEGGGTVFPSITSPDLLSQLNLGHERHTNLAVSQSQNLYSSHRLFALRVLTLRRKLIESLAG